MQVFKTFFRSLYVHRLSAMIYLIVFIMISLLMGINSTKSSDRAFASENLSVVVIDKDDSSISHAVKEYLGRTEKIVTPRSEDMQQLKDDAAFGIIDYAVVIPEGAQDAIESGDYDEVLQYVSYPQSAGGYLINRKIDQFIKNIIIFEKCGMEREIAVQEALDEASDEPEVQMLLPEKADSRGKVTTFFNYVSYAMIMILIIGICSVMKDFKQEDLVMRLDCSALKKSSKNAQLILSYFITGIFVWAIFLIIAFIYYGKSMDRIGFYAVNSFVIMIVGLSLSFFLGSFISDENIINMVANCIVMGMAFVSGIFVDQEYMEPSVLSFARFLPTYWYVKADILIRDSSVISSDMLVFARNLGIELLFAAVFLTAGMVMNSRQIKR